MRGNTSRMIQMVKKVQQKLQAPNKWRSNLIILPVKGRNIGLDNVLYVEGTIILPETAFTGNVIGDIVAIKEKTDRESRYAEENNEGNPIEHRTEAKFGDNTERSNEGTMQQGFSFVEVSESKSENNNNVNMKAFVCPGLVNGNEVQFLRDAGCTTAAVKKSLVENHQFTGNETLCTVIDGTVMKYPLARIHINTPYYVGTIEAIVTN